MQYEVKIEDFSVDLEVEIKSSNFDLISDIQMAIAQAIEDHKDEEDYGLFEYEEEDEEDQEEDEDENDSEHTLVLDDNDDTHTTITITRN
jgi:hypothetical protein